MNDLIYDLQKHSKQSRNSVHYYFPALRCKKFTYGNITKRQNQSFKNVKWCYLKWNKAHRPLVKRTLSRFLLSP